MDARIRAGLMLITGAVVLVALGGVALVVAGALSHGGGPFARLLARRARVIRVVVAIAASAILAATAGILLLCGEA